MQFASKHLSRRRFVHCLGAAATFSLLPGCAKRETLVEVGDRDLVLHLGNGTEPQDIDPGVVTGVQEYHIMMSLLEGLVSEDPVDLHPVPGVAERWDVSPDRRVYTFHLRDNAKWSNGEPVTARDFLETYQRNLTPSLGYEYSYMHFVVKNAEAYNTGKLTDFNQCGYKVIDDRTLEVTLDNPTPYFLSLLLHHSWYPVHMPTLRKYGDPYQRGNRWTRPGRYVGNGSFVLAKWRVNDVIEVRKSPTYWDRERVKLNAIRFYPIESDDTEERAFRAGQLHITYTLPPSKIEYYKTNNAAVLQIFPFLTTYFYRVNVTKPPVNDKRVRKALAMAIDRESIVKDIVKGGEIPAFNLTPPGTAGYTCRAQLREDIAAAKQLLAEAGYPDGKGMPPVEILYNTLESHRTIAEAIQEMWKTKLGVDARLVNEEWKVYLDSQRSLNYQVCRAGWTGDYDDPNTFLDLWTTGSGNNETGWSNPEYDQLIVQAAATVDPQQRLEVFQKAEALLMDEMPIIPIYFYTRIYLQRPEVKGWYSNILDNHPYKYMSLEAPK
ncbi:MAG TPA: peptide ABC transporter substrate-binding protein [Verrucomicrobiae bacterium]|jgi:oligopeptide transport system substrate-binding protein|nr:peptide ABC transporter substrate-binding protein [Verrucomicrobiae bacterium]